MLFTGCKEEGNVPRQAARLQLNLCIPVEGGRSAMYRIMGDPGKTETFQKPRYLYIIVMKEVSGVWSVWRKEERTLEDGDWIPAHYWGLRMNPNDSIFQYSKPINYILDNESPQGRVYAVCSKRKLTFNRSINSISNMDELLNLTFKTAPDSIQESLQDIYATPYNYIADERYYCSFDCSAGNTYIVDLLLYHVAAKVDITWSVEDTMRVKKDAPAEAVRLTYLEAQHLFNGDAYCFKPLRNQMATKESIGYSIPNIVTADDEGLWWEGRSYFYTIPYVATDVTDGSKVYFPLQLLMRTNGSAGDGYRPTLNMKIDTAEAVFVPWLRANVNISAPFTDKTETKTVND